LAAGLAVAPVVLLSAGATSQAADTGTQMVPTVLAGLPLATSLGAARAGQVLTIGVSLQRPDTSAEQQLYSELYDPSSPMYGQFLTPAQFDQQFGVPAASQSAVENWLQGGGLTIETTSGAGDYFTAEGTVAQLDQLFEVQIGRYSYKGENFVANNVPPSVPDDLPIDAVIGLDNYRAFGLASLTGPSKTQTSVGPQSGTEGILTPQDLWGVYDDPGAAAFDERLGNQQRSRASEHESRFRAGADDRDLRRGGHLERGGPAAVVRAGYGLPEGSRACGPHRGRA
jgi:subtilase family serine protease